MSFQLFQNKFEVLDSIANLKIIIGKSVMNKPIFAYHFGAFQGQQLLLTSSIHAREYISSLACLNIIQSHNFIMGCWFVPLVNPDGVKKVLESTDNSKYKLLKANVNYVDLNVNFDAKWGQGASNKQQKALENYIGPRPNSEPETQALVFFAKKLKPYLTLNFHTKGEVIYYGNFLVNKNKELDLYYAKLVSSATRFLPIKTKNSYGGFSDYIEMKLNLPALTIELGSDNYTHPITEKYLPNITYGIQNLLDALEDDLQKRSK